ncbi:GxxExxY protein [Lacipirellula limnantheis]|uniref:GxxExxY protein n=1 Tax=Lacipirellula limnantheis TaxID=2528024 RepID=UPI001FEB60D9|nr:GxxExxY protein [Lacipirellula limnantheis]
MTEPDPAVDALAKAAIGAAIEVHSLLGAGFLESVYEQALAVELGLRGTPFQRQHPIALTYIKVSWSAKRDQIF